MSDAIRVEAEGPVMVITIDRPAVRNAVDRDTAEALSAALDDLDSRPDVRAGVLTGAGGVFCAGMDLKAFSATGERPISAGRGAFGIVERPPATPLVAAVEGSALGGGLEIALACDLIVAARDAVLGLPEVKRGLVAAAGGVLRLPDRIPPNVAKAMVLTGDPITATVAEHHGLVNRVTAPGEALDGALGLAHAVAANAPMAARAAKYLVDVARDWPVDEAFARQASVTDPVRASADAAEGARAFVEKRAPCGPMVERVGGTMAEAMTDELTEEQRDLRDLAARLAADRYAPHAREWDEARTPLPHEERRRLGDLGLLALTIPEEYGGGGRPLIDALIVLEELAKATPLAAWPVFEASTGPARVIDLFGTDEQRKRFLPAVASGEKTIAVSISEPDAGSAATDAATTARIEGDEVVLNGTKRWCSGAGHAEQYLVYVRFGTTPGAKGMGAVLVDRDAPGLSFGPQDQHMGFRGVGSADIVLTDVRVPVDDVIVGEGGFGKLFSAFSIERLGNSTMSLAIGQTALDRTARYVQERRQFGKDIAEFQMVQGQLAEMVVAVDAARALIRRAATGAGHGAPVTLEASVAKCFANEMAKKVSDLAIQLHGGYGYSAEYEVERLHRDAHGWALAGGTPSMQRVRIASEYLGRRFDQRA